MSIGVVYNGTSKPSAVRLRECIEDITKQEVPFIFYNSDRTMLKNLTHLINVGNSNPFRTRNGVVIINPPSKIVLSANKRMARIRFKAKHVPAPELWLSPTDIPSCEFPVVGRTTHHMKGHGFWLCKNTAEATVAFRKGATHFLKFITNTREFRLHTFCSRSNPTSEKDYVVSKFVEKMESAKTRSRTIKNHDNGFVFLSPNFMSAVEKESILTAAKKAIFVCGLHYGAVDVILSKNNSKPYVLEINSTPCLTDENSNTAEVYATKLVEVVRMANK